MSAIRSKNTKPELLIRRWLFAQGYRYRINDKRIPGHPDLYFKKYNTAVFVNGCFWHRHKECKFAYTPKTRIEFWENKFSYNMERDQIVKTELSRREIKCLIIWECTIKKMLKDDAFKKEIINYISIFLNNTCKYCEL